MAQDPIEYNSFTWHTNLDTYERIVPEDAMAAAVVVAGEVWHVANRDAMLPRFTKEQMPAPSRAVITSRQAHRDISSPAGLPSASPADPSRTPA